MFTVPPGGDGYYHFSTYLQSQGGEFGYCHIQLNGTNICTAFLNHKCPVIGSCAAYVRVSAGDKVRVTYYVGTDETPIKEGNNIRNEFHGFRLN